LKKNLVFSPPSSPSVSSPQILSPPLSPAAMRTPSPNIQKSPHRITEREENLLKSFFTEMPPKDALNPANLDRAVKVYTIDLEKKKREREREREILIGIL
jgi:hypothetical protein